MTIFLCQDICLCSRCDVMLHEGDDMVQNPIYKVGELSGVELAHRACAPEWARNDDWHDARYAVDDTIVEPEHEPSLTAMGYAFKKALLI